MIRMGQPPTLYTQFRAKRCYTRCVDIFRRRRHRQHICLRERLFIDNWKLVYGITIRLAGIAVLLNNSEQTVSVAQGKQIDAAVRFLQNGRHNSYQP